LGSIEQLSDFNQKLSARTTGVGRIAIRKMHADISLTGRP
jgi:TfoX/Sxy family transcriptional regulator of competence genes